MAAARLGHDKMNLTRMPAAAACAGLLKPEPDRCGGQPIRVHRPTLGTTLVPSPPEPRTATAFAYVWGLRFSRTTLGGREWKLQWKLQWKWCGIFVDQLGPRWRPVGDGLAFFRARFSQDAAARASDGERADAPRGAASAGTGARAAPWGRESRRRGCCPRAPAGRGAPCVVSVGPCFFSDVLQTVLSRLSA